MLSTVEMNRKKKEIQDNKKKTPSRIFKSPAGVYIGIFIFFFILLCVYPGNNLFTYISARCEIREQERQMRRYKNEIVRMQNTMEELTQDIDTLEKFARENFHFAEPGEDVYLLGE